MGLIALGLVALALWLTFTGRLQRLRGTDGVMLGLAIVGAILAAKGRPIVGGLPLVLSLIYSIRRLTAPRPGPQPIPAADEARLSDARALLGLDNDADEAAIRSAHRRLIARAHPDTGGTQALAEKINNARDLLLAHEKRKRQQRR